MTKPLKLRIELPIASFRPYEGRDYQETYPAPPPATVAGMLFSLCGLERDEVEDYMGFTLAIGVNHDDPPSSVLRKMRRDPSSNPSGEPQFRPDYQELLFDLMVWCIVRDGPNKSITKLIREALVHPERIERYGSLSMGESSFVVDSVSEVGDIPEPLFVLSPNEQGYYSMPVWVDFTNRTRTVRARFDFERGVLEEAHATILMG